MKIEDVFQQINDNIKEGGISVELKVNSWKSQLGVQYSFYYQIRDEIGRVYDGGKTLKEAYLNYQNNQMSFDKQIDLDYFKVDDPVILFDAVGEFEMNINQTRQMKLAV